MNDNTTTFMTLSEDVVLQIYAHVDISSLRTLSHTCKHSQNMIKSHKLIERAYVRKQGFHSLRQFRQICKADVHNIGRVLRNIHVQARSPDIRTEDDKVFMSLFYHLAKKFCSSMKAAASIRNGVWVQGLSPTKADRAWYGCLESSHPEHILNAVECMEEWDGVFL